MLLFSQLSAVSNRAQVLSFQVFEKAFRWRSWCGQGWQWCPRDRDFSLGSACRDSRSHALGELLRGGVRNLRQRFFWLYVCLIGRILETGKSGLSGIWFGILYDYMNFSLDVKR